MTCESAIFRPIDMARRAAGRIEVNEGSLNWGPFEFDFTGDVPPGDSIASVAVTSALGAPPGTDSTAELIGASALSGNIASVRFSYPGGGLTGAHRLFFEVTFGSGATQRFEFDYVEVST